MASYIDNSASTQSIGVSYSRTKSVPLDRSSMFSSYSDAVEYAKGQYKADGEARAKAHDSRKLAGTSYVGQILTVYENDIVSVYKIDYDRSLKIIGGGDSIDKIDCGTYE